MMTITTDTGAFTPGDREFSRYTTIGFCVVAAREKQKELKKAINPLNIIDSSGDGIGYADTVGNGAAALVARACGAHFTVATTPASELAHLFALAVWEQNDTLAQVILARQIAQVALQNTRDELWENALKVYLTAGRRAAADTLMAQVDAQGSRARNAQLSMHSDLLGEYEWRDVDTARFRTEFEHLLKMTETSPKVLDLASYIAEWTAIDRWVQQNVWKDTSAIVSLAIRAKRELSQYKVVPEVVNNQLIWYPWPSYSVPDAYNAIVHKMFRYRERAGRVIAPQLHADYWFPVPGRPSSDTVRPLLGKINLICTADRDPLIGNPLLRKQILEWLARYGRENLEVTLVRPAAGYFAIDNTVTRFSLVGRTPAEEAQAWRWYTQDYEQLPVTVAVQVRHDQWIPTPDGRRLNESALQFNEFWRHDPDYVKSLTEYSPPYSTSMDSTYGFRPAEVRGGSCAVIDRDGTILHTSMENDPMVNTDGALRLLFHGQRIQLKNDRNPIDQLRATPR